jgi:hypothetical protein
VRPLACATTRQDVELDDSQVGARCSDNAYSRSSGAFAAVATFGSRIVDVDARARRRERPW